MSNPSRRALQLRALNLALLTSLVFWACSSEEGGVDAGGGLGASDSGGAWTSGGTTASGGSAPSSGGAISTGGDFSGGGASSAGGAPPAATGGASGEEPALGDATVWLAGDSTVANGNTPCPVGWGKSFDSLFDERIRVVNAAAGGRSVRTWLYDVKDTMDDSGECVLTRAAGGEPILQARWRDMLDGMKAGDFLFVQFGINDGSRTCPRHVGLGAFRESYAMMAEAALERGAQPIFVTPVSAIACNGSTPVGTRGGFVQAVIELGASLGVPVIDLHARSVALYRELGFCPVPGGDVSAATGGDVGAFFCDDHTHFDAPGALEIAELVAAGLRSEGMTLAEYLL